MKASIIVPKCKNLHFLCHPMWSSVVICVSPSSNSEVILCTCRAVGLRCFVDISLQVTSAASPARFANLKKSAASDETKRYRKLKKQPNHQKTHTFWICSMFGICAAWPRKRKERRCHPVSWTEDKERERRCKQHRPRIGPSLKGLVAKFTRQWLTYLNQRWKKQMW